MDLLQQWNIQKHNKIFMLPLSSVQPISTSKKWHFKFCIFLHMTYVQAHWLQLSFDQSFLHLKTSPLHKTKSEDSD